MISDLKNNDEPLYFNVDDIKKKEPYIHNKKTFHLYQSIKKNGQMKLLINEIRFLSYDIEIHNLKDNKFNLLYIGSGKGYHIPFLINMYKKYDIHWYFYDPVGHCEELNKLQNDKNIFIKNEYFLEKDIEKFKNIKERNLIFITDIRTVDENEFEPKTINLYHDFVLQNKILEELKPMFSLLKYRIPFEKWEEPLEFFKPKGKEYIQCFTKNDSCEFRIFLNSIIIYEKLNFSVIQDYEERFNWYNTNYRICKKNDLQIALFVFNYYNNVENKIKINKNFILDYLKNISKTF